MTKQARYREKHREKGLCLDCSRPVDSGRSRCIKHLKHQREYFFRNDPDKREKRSKAGLCTGCGRKKHPEVDKGKRKCLGCRESLFLTHRRNK